MSRQGLPNNPLIEPSDLSGLHADAIGWARSLLPTDPAQAEELVQQAYLHILEGRARYDGRAALKTWLFAVIRNLSRRHYRWLRLRRSRHARLQSLAADELSTPAGGAAARDDGAPDHILRTHIAHLIRSLPSRQRQVLELTVYREFSLQDCARIMGLSVGTVRTHYHRAKRKLEQELIDVAGGGDRLLRQHQDD